MAGKEYTAKDKIFSMGDTLIRGSLKKLIKEHDFPPIVFHSLRHTSVEQTKERYFYGHR